MFWHVPWTFLGKAKGTWDSIAFLSLSARTFEGKELPVHSVGSFSAEAEKDLDTWNAAINAVVSQPGPMRP